MKRFQQPKPISSLVRMENKIDPKPEYQRSPVWSKKQKQLLIDTILRDLDIPKFYLRTVKNEGYEYEVVDGQQRLRAIWEFRRGVYKLSKDTDPISEISIANLAYNDLPEDLKDKFDTYTLDTIILEDSTLDEVEEMFVRLQNGTSLKAAEKRNALPGNMKHFIRDLSKNNFFEKCGFNNKRYDFDQVAAQCTLIELNGGPTNIKNTDLEKMYKQNQKFEREGTDARRIGKVFNYLSRSFKEKTPELERHNVISLYILVSMLLEKFAVIGYEEKIRDWFIEFETKRLAEKEIQEDKRDPELVAYQNAIGHSSDSIESLEYRHKILSRNFFMNFEDIIPLDNTRTFSYEQRLAIFRKNKGECQLKLRCEGAILGWEDDWHADHKLPYSQGGKTSVENGQVACAACNLTKGSDII